MGHEGFLKAENFVQLAEHEPPTPSAIGHAPERDTDDCSQNPHSFHIPVPPSKHDAVLLFYKKIDAIVNSAQIPPDNFLSAIGFHIGKLPPRAYGSNIIEINTEIEDTTVAARFNESELQFEAIKEPFSSNVVFRGSDPVGNLILIKTRGGRPPYSVEAKFCG